MCVNTLLPVLPVQSDSKLYCCLVILVPLEFLPRPGGIHSPNYPVCLLTYDPFCDPLLLCQHAIPYHYCRSLVITPLEVPVLVWRAVKPSSYGPGKRVHLGASLSIVPSPSFHIFEDTSSVSSINVSPGVFILQQSILPTTIAEPRGT